MPWLPGVIAALYVSRVFVEFGPPGWPASLAWLAAIMLGIAGFTITLAIHAFGCGVAPLATLALYLISPTINPRLAAATAFVAATGVLLLAVDDPAAGVVTRRIPRSARQRPPESIMGLSSHLLLDTAVFLAGLATFVATLSPGLLPADSGEFQLIVPTLGIAHPPGYALYTLVGKLVTLIPVGTPAYRLNLLSAVLAAATLMLVNRSTRRLTSSVVAGLVAVAALAGATTFWAQATTTNIRMPTAFLAALLVWLLVRYGETPRDRDLVATAFLSGLSLIHHGSLVFIVVPALLFVVWVQPAVLRRYRLLTRCAAAFTTAMLVLLYFPIRSAAGAPLDPGGLTSISGFLNHVLARGFRGDVLAFTGPEVLGDRLRVLSNILTIQFGWPLLAVAAIGLLSPLIQSLVPNLRWTILRQYPAQVSNLQYSFTTQHWLLLTSAFTLTTGAAITYRAPQTVEYLMPAYVVVAILLGVGITVLQGLIPSPSLRAVTLSLSLLFGLVNMWHIAPSYRELSRQSDTRQVVEPILQDAPADSLILSNWHWATAFWYLQTVEGLRPDVDVEYIAPAGAEPYPETWRRRLTETVDGRPVVVTNRYPTYSDLPARLLPFHGAFQVATDAVQVPADVQHLNLNFEATIQLIGYRLSSQRIEPDGDLTVTLWWQPLVDAQQDYSVFVHLVDDAGAPKGQADVRYPASRLVRGTLIEDTYTISVPPTVAPNLYRVIAGFYFTPPEGGFRRLTANGADSVQLGQVAVAPRETAPVSSTPLYVPFADGPVLVGVEYDTSQPFDMAQAARIYLHWLIGPVGPWAYALKQAGERIGINSVPHGRAGSFVTTALDLPPGAGRLDLEVMDTRPPSQVARIAAPLGAWRLPVLGSSVRLPRIRPGSRYLIFGGEMALLGASWKVEGDTVVVDLEWLGLKPLVRDYTVSVQLVGESGWRAQDDGTPALGAIPTLKWIRGTRVTDRHRVELPEEAAGRAAIQISVYDAFTSAPLAVLDDRFQRAGQGQAAVIGWTQ